MGNVIVDVEPFLVLTLGSKYPLHGYLHTFLLAFLLGIILGYIMLLLEDSLRTVYRTFLLESDKSYSLKSFLLAGTAGIALHVLMDSPIYDDIRPFYPLTVNPLYNPNLTLWIYAICVWLGVLGVIWYVCLRASGVLRRFLRSEKVFAVWLWGHKGAWTVTREG